MSEFENSDEKAYRSMNFIGIVNISLGIVMVVVSAVCGAFIIAGGAKLLKDKKGITREFDNLIRYEVHQSQIWLIFFVKS